MSKNPQNRNKMSKFNMKNSSRKSRLGIRSIARSKVLLSHCASSSSEKKYLFLGRAPGFQGVGIPALDFYFDKLSEKS